MHEPFQLGLSLLHWILAGLLQWHWPLDGLGHLKLHVIDLCVGLRLRFLTSLEAKGLSSWSSLWY